MGQRFHLEKNKEVLDAELFAIRRAMRILLEREATGVGYTVFSDSRVAIERIWRTEPDPVVSGPRQGRHRAREAAD